MTMWAILLVLVLAVNGLAAGVLVGTQLGGWPLLRSLPAGPYVHAHAFFATRYDPFMPVSLLLTVLLDAALAAAAPVPVPARLLQAGAALAVAVTISVSLTKNVPVNKWVQQLDPEHLPADFARRDPRRHWGRWNSVRTWLTVAALAVNATAAWIAFPPVR